MESLGKVRLSLSTDSWSRRMCLNSKADGGRVVSLIAGKEVVARV